MTSFEGGSSPVESTIVVGDWLDYGEVDCRDMFEDAEEVQGKAINLAVEFLDSYSPTLVISSELRTRTVKIA